ncbi:MAG TPA: thymidine phosphorylase [Chloroflexota bacterium]|nr:thymidine phosphorylase [Chloroflexota bacterium]
MTRSILEVVRRKRDGRELTGSEIDHLVESIVDGTLADHQIGALLMAIYLRGLTEAETAELTRAMVRSGETLDLRSIVGFKADKHSTGGVGDKVTLVLGPLVAAAGVKFPKLSGRGLAHTGGTLDKLESIPGMRVDLTLDELLDQVRHIGLAVTGQTAELVPADGIIYALRDQTATVDSIPLIASSVMSKKIAAGADGIVLDVKCGSGAFMKTLNSARELANLMVAIGKSAGKRTVAMITSMDTPLGNAIGNALEVGEAIQTLHGSGPADLEAEVIAFGSCIVEMAGISAGEDAQSLLREKLRDGSAAAKLAEMIEWQGGDSRVVDQPSLLPSAQRVIPVTSSVAGYVQSIDGLSIGMIGMDLGAGRRAKGEPVSPSAGVVLRAKPSSAEVQAGDVLAELHMPPDHELHHPIPPLDELQERLRRAYRFGSQPAPESPSILAVIH